jgi:hypothetical protein
MAGLVLARPGHPRFSAQRTTARERRGQKRFVPEALAPFAALPGHI